MVAQERAIPTQKKPYAPKTVPPNTLPFLKSILAAIIWTIPPNNAAQTKSKPVALGSVKPNFADEATKHTKDKPKTPNAVGSAPV
ncbi:hypothetical protein SDC9_206694 [bioreactor metagenome]|uniref:Uncharacterized protein n=1 Tax=bioreactor metagenome TaxID=1076179 RepID=A0A645J6G0_9ZZZZ